MPSKRGAVLDWVGSEGLTLVRQMRFTGAPAPEHWARGGHERLEATGRSRHHAALTCIST
ncbi:hypothetical protein SGPA1_50480 [Streptomyces misionensis JCM 4497]